MLPSQFIKGVQARTHFIDRRRDEGNLSADARPQGQGTSRTFLLLRGRSAGWLIEKSLKIHYSLPPIQNRILHPPASQPLFSPSDLHTMCITTLVVVSIVWRESFVTVDRNRGEGLSALRCGQGSHSGTSFLSRSVCYTYFLILVNLKVTKTPNFWSNYKNMQSTYLWNPVFTNCSISHPPPISGIHTVWDKVFLPWGKTRLWDDSTTEKVNTDDGKLSFHTLLSKDSSTCVRLPWIRHCCRRWFLQGLFSTWCSKPPQLPSLV